MQCSSIVNNLTQGDESLLETLESLCDNNKGHSEEGRMTSSFVSDYVFNLSKKVLSQTEINVLEKALGFSPTPSFINKADLRREFNEFSRNMRCKWYFRNKTQSSKEIPTFHSKSTWNSSKGSPALELFLNKTEQNFFSVSTGKAEQLNLTREEYLTMRNIQEDRNVIIKPADKGSAVVIWDRNKII